MTLSPELLATLMSGSEQDMRATAMNTFLSQMGEDDPQTKLIAQLLAQSAENDDADEKEEDSFNEAFDEAHDAELEAAEEAAIRDLEEMINEVYEELEFLRSWSDTLAAALGACELCWGVDQGCELCRGRGVSGWRQPDHHLFREFIMPAVMRVKHDRRRPRN